MPAEQRQALVEMALDCSELSPRELAVRFSEAHRYFISEATAYRILLEHDYLPGDLERAIGEFVTHDNERRYHESLNNLTPADVWRRGGQAVLDHRRQIKETTLQLRKQVYFERKTA